MNSTAPLGQAPLFSMEGSRQSFRLLQQFFSVEGNLLICSIDEGTAAPVTSAVVVIATHGPTGKSRWVLGGVKDKVLRAADRTIGFERAKTSMAGEAR